MIGEGNRCHMLKSNITVLMAHQVEGHRRRGTRNSLWSKVYITECENSFLVVTDGIGGPSTDRAGALVRMGGRRQVCNRPGAKLPTVSLVESRSTKDTVGVSDLGHHRE